jgi:hypothetical protein
MAEKRTQNSVAKKSTEKVHTKLKIKGSCANLKTGLDADPTFYVDLVDNYKKHGRHLK